MSGSACKTREQPVPGDETAPVPATPARPGHAAVRTASRAALQSAYRAALFRHLTDDPASEIEFFVNAARFDLMRRAIGPLLNREGLSILNAASGPFAFEFYAAPPSARIRSFDHDRRLVRLHRELSETGLIAQCEFEVREIQDFRAAGTFDLVLANDLFYAPSLDLFAHLRELTRSVSPGGTLYFDVQDVRAGPVWKAFGKGGQTRRYNLQEVRSGLEAQGFTVTAMIPSLGIKGGFDRTLRQLLWSGMGIANNFAFIANRNG